MRFSFRIFLGVFLVLGLGGYLFFSSFMQEIKPGLRQSAEESLVDIANLLAELVAEDVKNNNINAGHLATAVKAFQGRKFNATIWNITKQQTNLQFYITDDDGIVLFDSTGRNLGSDFSEWNDVYLTLRGEYGARSTLADPTNKSSSVMHVAAPILDQDKIIGVVSVRKSNLSIQPFFEAAQDNLTRKGGLLLLFSLTAGLILSFWLSGSIRKLAEYANAVRHGKNVSPPEVYGTELKQLATSMAAMKEELEGKKYIEQYVHTLAHQLKTPIASIQGAAELLNEEMPVMQRQRFFYNIRQEAERLQQIVQYMLSLAAIESRQQLDSKQTVALKPLTDEIIQSQLAAIGDKSLTINNHLADSLKITGDRFLLQQAFLNLLDNAIGFSPVRGAITISSESENTTVTVNITDEGPGIPEFAEGRLFERFYSLPKPNRKQKGSGLGLCFVKEIARLHGGDIQLSNRHPQGVTARFRLPG